MRKPGASHLESLEPRQLFAAVSYTDNILNITGNSTRTDVHVTKDFADLSITGVVQRTTIARIASQIGKKTPSMIRINLGGAGESVTVDKDVTIPVYVNSGGGNDTIVGGAGDDTILSGSGNDSIKSGTGHNYIMAGAGNDSIIAQKGDTVWSQDGNDVVSGTTDMSNTPTPGVTPDGLTTQKFSIGSNTATTVGFYIAELQISDVDGTGATIAGSARDITTHVVSTTTVNGVVTEVFANADFSIVITATMKQSASLNTINAVVTNNSTSRITQVLFSMPRIYASVTSNFATLSAFRGGTEMNWPTAGFTQQGGGTWPGIAYSPIGAFYDKSTNEGVGVVAFNSRLDTTLVYWTLSASTVDAASRVTPNLDRGQSATYQMAIVRGSNMPNDLFNFYRQTYLQPFMATQGIPEAQSKKTGVWGTADWVNSTDTLTHVAAQTMASGATGFVQWSPADGLSQYYESFDPSNGDFPWAKDLPATAKLPGLQALGVLIDPFESARIPNGDGTFHQVDQNIGSAAVQALVLKQRDAMVKLGVNFAFWDTGGQPRNGSGQDWINMLWSFRKVGIYVAPESSCDIAGWIGGGVVEYPYTWNSFSVSKGVTPNATMFAVMSGDQSMVVGGQNVPWWQDAQNKGVVPILTQAQLRERAADLVLL